MAINSEDLMFTLPPPPPGINIKKPRLSEYVHFLLFIFSLLFYSIKKCIISQISFLLFQISPTSCLPFLIW